MLLQLQKPRPFRLQCGVAGYLAHDRSGALHLTRSCPGPGIRAFCVPRRNSRLCRLLLERGREGVRLLAEADRELGLGPELCLQV